MPAFKRIDDLGDLSGKRVLVRVDLNVPLEDGSVSDDTRIRAALPTIAKLREAGAIVILLAHFGRPKGKRVEEMSLKPVLPALERLAGEPVAFGGDCIGAAAQAAVDSGGGLVLLENLRFHAGEEVNDQAFAKELAALGDVYVNDAFSVSHRAHASVEAIARLLPAAAGEAMAAELAALEKALERPEKPVVAIIGGAKVSTKLEVLGNLLARVEHLVIGGGMANTFLYAKGVAIGASLAEREMVETAREILKDAETRGVAMHLPTDAVLARALEAGAETRTAGVDSVGDEEMILDIGPETAGATVELLEGAKTLLWNGPVGAFETAPFDRGTLRIAEAAAELTRAGALLSVVGGGDTVAALNRAGIAGDISHVSTAGGAFLEWLEGKTLPGVAALAHS